MINRWEYTVFTNRFWILEGGTYLLELFYCIMYTYTRRNSFRRLPLTHNSKYSAALLRSICFQKEKLCDMLMSNDCVNTFFAVASPSLRRSSRCHMLILNENKFKTCPLCSINTYKLRFKQHNKHCGHTVN